MTDLEAVRLCAEALGRKPGGLAKKAVCYNVSKWAIIASNDRGGEDVYDPLTNKAQAFELVERFNIHLWHDTRWAAQLRDRTDTQSIDDDLPRAIVYCVARMREASSSKEFPNNCLVGTK